MWLVIVVVVDSWLVELVLCAVLLRKGTKEIARFCRCAGEL